MTAQQAAALAFIRAFIGEKGYSPSYAEIGEHLGLRSKSGIYRLVHSLRERGHIALIPSHHHSITIVEGDQDAYDAGYQSGWDDCIAYMRAGRPDKPPGLPAPAPTASAAA